MKGALFYIIGASGTGKDSLLEYARNHMSEGADFVFAHRYITRPADAGSENHIALSSKEFAKRLEKSCFAMHWSSHGLKYGIGKEVLAWQKLGLHVVINGSREYLPTAAANFPDLIPVLIEVDRDILEQRLIARGRETKVEVVKRLQRAEQFTQTLQQPNLKRLTNNASLEEAGERFLSLLLSVIEV